MVENFQNKSVVPQKLRREKIRLIIQHEHEKTLLPLLFIGLLWRKTCSLGPQTVGFTKKKKKHVFCLFKKETTVSLFI